MVKLNDAIREGAELAKRLKGREAAVVHSLVELAEKVRASRPAIRALAEALSPDAHLNQESLFADTKPSEEKP